MSGLEIAGVVLGALPLVISALEHYANGINTAKRFWRYKSEVRSLILQINTERGIFINTLEQLLVGIVRIEHMTEFLSSPGGDVWQEEDIDIKLKDRLRGAYEVYLGNVGGMVRALEVMMKKLALDPDGKPQFSDPSLFKQEYKRLKFSLGKSEYSEQLADLRNYNQALTRLTKQSLELEPTRVESKTRFCPNFTALQNYARSVFETLRASLHCKCDGHAVKLRLENRSLEIEKEEDLENTPFRVIFTYTSTTANSQWTWKEADIKCILDKVERVPLTPTTSNISMDMKYARRVRFDEMRFQQSQSETTLTMVEQQTCVSSKPPVEQIPDLCRMFAKMQVEQSLNAKCAGYVVDNSQRKHGIYLLEPPAGNDQASNQKWTAYTLRQVLSRHVSVRKRLTQLDKFRVAVDLASSVLQLYKTPWLEESWNEDDVYFVLRPGAHPSTIYQHPFIYRKFSSITTKPCHSASPARRVIRNQTLFTLGILLIELLYGKPIEELQMPHDLECQGTPGVAWCTAERLIEEEIAFEAGPLYSDAVRRCIRCDFNRNESSLDNRDFQRAVFDGVVAPLEKTLQRFNGIE